MAEPRKDLGENDASFIDTVSNAAEKAADSISHKLHPMIDFYAYNSFGQHPERRVGWFNAHM